MQHLINEGYLAEPVFHSLNLGDAETRDCDSDEYLNQIGLDRARNLKVCGVLETALGKHERVIVFMPSLAAVDELAELAQKRGLSVAKVRGDTDQRERSEVLDVFRNGSGEPMAVLNCGVLTTGFDAPRTSCAIIARPTRSLVLFSQMVGRALRGKKNGGNRHAEVFAVPPLLEENSPHAEAFSSPDKAFRHWNPLWGVS